MEYLLKLEYDKQYNASYLIYFNIYVQRRDYIYLEWVSHKSLIYAFGIWGPQHRAGT